MLACRTGAIFLRFSGERGQAQGEREVRDTRDGTPLPSRVSRTSRSPRACPRSPENAQKNSACSAVYQFVKMTLLMWGRRILGETCNFITQQFSTFSHFEGRMFHFFPFPLKRLTPCYFFFFPRPVCEVEIEYGLLQAENPKRSCVWLHRVISGLNSPANAEHPEVLKYLDDKPNGTEHNDETHPQVLLHNLKNKKMKEAMALENIFTYDVTWTPKGNSFMEISLVVRS